MKLPLNMHNKTRIIWLYPGSLEKTLDRASWLEVSLELRKLGWDVLILSEDSNEKWLRDQEEQGVKIGRINCPSIYFIGKLIFHIKAIWLILTRFFKFEIVFYTQESAIFLLPLFLIKKVINRNSPKFVLDSRSMPMGLYTSKLRVRGRYYLWVNKNGTLMSDYQTVITSRMRDALRIPEEKIISIWPSGVNIEKFKAVSVGRLWGSTGSTPMKLIYIGSLSVDRNIHNLCKAVTNVRQAGYLISLTLVGDGDLINIVKEYSHDPISGITYLPTQPPEEIPYILANAQVGILPFPDEIQYQVSSPLKLFEYLASGLVIIATRINCHVDVLGNSEVFWAESSDIISLQNAIIAAYHNQARFPQISEKSYELADEWTWKRSAEKLSTGFKKIL